jgi:hypothetical protein
MIINKTKSPELELIAADPVIGQYDFKSKKGTVYTLIFKDDRLFFFEKVEPIGYISPGSDHSGAIFLSGDCLGEYSLEKGKYTVLPYEEGQKQFDKKREVHPLDYLVEIFEQRGS